MNLYEAVKNNLKESKHSSDYLNEVKTLKESYDEATGQYYYKSGRTDNGVEHNEDDYEEDDPTDMDAGPVTIYDVWLGNTKIAEDVGTFQEALKIAKENGSNYIAQHTWFKRKYYENYEPADYTVDIEVVRPKNDGLKESEGSGLNDSIKSWYLKEFPEDDYGEHLKDDVTFKQVYDTLGNVEEFYPVIFNGDYEDSIVRERIFGELSDRMNIDYDVIYYKWLYGREDGKSPNEGNHYNVKDTKEIIQSTLSESEDALDYRASYKEIYGGIPDYTDLRRVCEELDAIYEQAEEDGYSKSYLLKSARNKLSTVCEELEEFYEGREGE